MVDQIPVLLAPLTTPFSEALGLLEQTNMSAPALAPGPSVNVMVKLSVTTTQPPIEVSVSVTLPVAVSALLGT